MISRRSSGSSRADRAVEPTRSQNITVSWRRSADNPLGVGGGAEAVVKVAAGAPALLVFSLAPHSEQNFAPVALLWPQDGHRAFGTSRRAIASGPFDSERSPRGRKGTRSVTDGAGGAAIER